LDTHCHFVVLIAQSCCGAIAYVFSLHWQGVSNIPVIDILMSVKGAETLAIMSACFFVWHLLLLSEDRLVIIFFNIFFKVLLVVSFPFFINR
jgi:hypothetical protein